MTDLTFIDLFAGVGMARMGMEQAGFKCVYTCEFDKHKRKEYEIIHGNIPEGCDIRDVRATDIPRADVWFFGAPCQDFSLAGLRKGLGGDRSSLIGEVFRLIEEKAEDKPEWLVYENVKGMLNTNDGWDFLSILLAMDGLGYDVEWQTLNTKDFGIPQNRERVYTIGHLRSRGRRQVLPVRRESSSHLKQLIGGMQSYRVYDTSGISTTLVGEGGGVGAKTGLYMIDQSLTTPKVTNTARCITARYTSGATKRTAMNTAVLEVAEQEGIKVRNGTKKGYQVANVGDSVDLSYPGSRTRRARVGKGLAHNLSCGGQMGAVVWKGKTVKIRRLTPKECFRLQGFPDELFEKACAVNSDAQLYKQVGNGVTVSVVFAIGKAILNAIKENHDE